MAHGRQVVVNLALERLREELQHQKEDGHQDGDEQAAQGARVFSDLARARGATQVEVSEAAQIGAIVASREFGQRAELEADAIGTIIAERAGYDAWVGAGFFTRIPDPARDFLSTHPPNAARIDVVRRTLQAIRGPGA